MKYLTIALITILFACEKHTVEPQQTKTQHMTDTTRNGKLANTANVRYVFEANCNIVEGVYQVNGKDYTFCGQGTEFSFEFETKQEQRLEIGAKIKDKPEKQVRLRIFVDSQVVADKIVEGKGAQIHRFGSVKHYLENKKADQ